MPSTSGTPKPAASKNSFTKLVISESIFDFSTSQEFLRISHEIE